MISKNQLIAIEKQEFGVVFISATKPEIVKLERCVCRPYPKTEWAKYVGKPLSKFSPPAMSLFIKDLQTDRPLQIHKALILQIGINGEWVECWK